MKPQNSTKLVGLLGVLLTTFGITYFDFTTVMSETNLKPALMMGLGIVAIIFYVLAKKDAGK